MVKHFVAGEPVAQPRPRAVSIGGRTRVYNPSTAKKWKLLVGSEVLQEFGRHGQTRMMGAVSLRLEFFLKRPKSHFGTGKNQDTLKASAPEYCTKKPDLDNIVKAVLDALTNHGIWKDDSQVVQLLVLKRWADGCDNGVYIEIEEK
ncbi:MAG: RusA family crossover junction endodeoxyribonuclease [Gammaproteobacteria bacterium]|nr:RusA family crossover junction endodeoxyribonuclease [Gammaproteobacteria bacterium]